MFRLTALCLALTTLTWTVVAEDRSDTDSLRSTYESKFEELDSDNNGQLDDKELMRLPPADLQSFRSPGLPEAGPVPRDVFIAAGVALASAAATPPPDSGGDPVPGNDEAVDESAKPPGTVAPAKGPHVRNSAKKSHYVPELPSEFRARDKNGDGQIALYEWDRKKYAEFAKLDKNGDGFLTPAELLPKGSLKALYAKAPTRASGKAPAAVSGTPGNTAVASNLGGDPDAVEGEARNTFVQMDVDKDGSIDETDWGRSRRIRPWFDSAGITVSLPMNADTFVALYRRAKESGGR